MISKYYLHLMDSSNQKVVLWRYANRHLQYGECQAEAFSDLVLKTKSRKIRNFRLSLKFSNSCFLQGMIKMDELRSSKKLIVPDHEFTRFDFFKIQEIIPPIVFFCDLWRPLLVVILNCTSAIQKAIII